MVIFHSYVKLPEGRWTWTCSSWNSWMAFQVMENGESQSDEKWGLLSTKKCLDGLLVFKKQLHFSNTLIGWWWLEPWNLIRLSRNSWEWNNHPNWQSPWFFRGVYHQPDMFSFLQYFFKASKFFKATRTGLTSDVTNNTEDGRWIIKVVKPVQL